METEPQQKPAPPAENIQKTQSFFSQWGGYHQLVNELDSYRRTTAALQGEIQGRLLDVGDGGGFYYQAQAGPGERGGGAFHGICNLPPQTDNRTRFLCG